MDIQVIMIFYMMILVAQGNEEEGIIISLPVRKDIVSWKY